MAKAATKTKKPKTTKTIKAKAKVPTETLQEAIINNEPSREKGWFGRNRKTVLLTLVVLALALVPSLYFYSKYQSEKEDDKEKQLQSLVEQVGDHAELPINEKPVTATVSDVSKLANQPFFAHAKNGDKVLVYQKGNRAVLYRPSTDKIIEIRPYNTEPGAPAGGAAPTPTTTPAQ